MTINYFGQMKDSRQNTRCAEIGFDEENEKDSKLAERLIDLMEKVTAWKCSGGFDDCYLVEVDDRQDYEEFKAWYKEAKKMLANCMRYGF